MTSKHSLVASIFSQMDWAARRLSISDTIMQNELKRFKFREITADRIRVQMDNGSYESLLRLWFCITCLTLEINLIKVEFV